jgi:chromate transporter
VAALIILFTASSVAQIAAILMGGVAGVWLCRASASPSTGHMTVPVSRAVGLVALAIFFLLLAGLPVLRGFSTSPGMALFEAFYRSGALAFGGGHVVLPLLRDAFVRPGWVSDDTFLAGYGAAQAIPGPLFTFVYWRRRQAFAARRAGRCAGFDRDLSSRPADPHGHAALLGNLPEACRCAGREEGR